MGGSVRFLPWVGLFLFVLAAASPPAWSQEPDLSLQQLLLASDSPGVEPGGAPVDSVYRGATVRITALIGNAGTGPAGEFTVEFSWRRVDKEEACCSERVTVPAGLEPGSQTTLDATIPTADLTPGTYEIAARVDPDDRVREFDETNNRKTVELKVLASRPELHSTTLDFNPASPVRRGETARISTEIENTGESTAGEFQVRFLWCKGEVAECFDAPESAWTLFGSALVPGLKRDERLLLERTLDTSALTLDSQEEGRVTPYTIRVAVDLPDSVREEDESNNEIFSSLGITPSDLSLPELRPVTLTFNKPLPLDWGRETSEGVTATVLVTNSGGSTAHASSQAPIAVSFAYRRLGAKDWTEVPAKEIEPIHKSLGIEEENNSATATADLVFDEPGSYELRAWVDPKNELDEQNEENNQIIVGFSVKGSELHPSSIELGTAPVRQGDTISVASLVENTGEKTATSFAVGFMIDERRFDTFSYSGEGLEEDQSVKAQGVLETKDLPPGAYTLRVFVDPDDRVPELDEANNVISTPLLILTPLARRAELHPESLVLAPPSPVSAGQGVRASATIWNSGTIDAERFQVELAASLDGGATWTPFALVEVPSLARGEKRVVEGHLAAAGPVAARYLVRTFVDSKNQVEEEDETNNLLVTSLSVGAPTAPGPIQANLTVSDLQASVPSPQRGPAQVCAEISNVGQGPAGEFLVEFSYRPQAGPFIQFSTKSLPGLGPGQSVSLCETLDTTGLPLGSLEVKVAVDPANWVTELDETDNERIRTLAPTPLPQWADLTPIAWRLDPPSPVDQGTSALVCVKVANLGAGTAGPFTVSYAYSLTSYVSFATATVPGLRGGGEIELCRALDTSSLAPGTYAVRVTVDPDRRVAEQNENNNELSAYFTVNVPPRPTLRPLLSTGGAVRLVRTDPVSGTLYVASEDGKLYALGRDGAPVAGFPFDAASPIHSLALDTGAARTAYVGTAGGTIHTVGLDTGQEIRETSLGGEVLALGLDKFGNLYAGTTDRLVSLTRAGEPRWESPTAGAVRALLVDQARDVLYAAAAGGVLHAITSTGALKWQLDLGSPLFTLALGEAIYVGTEDGRVVAVSLGGRAVASFTAAGAILGLAVDAERGPNDARVYATSIDGSLYSLDRTLTLRWTVPSGGPIRSAPGIDGRTGAIVFGSDDGRLRVVNSDGSEAFSVSVASPIRSTPVIDVTVTRKGAEVELVRTILFGAEDRTVYWIKTRL